MTDTQWTPEFDSLLRQHLVLLGPDKPLTSESPMPALGLDSLAIVALLVQLEEYFGVDLPDELLTVQTFATPSTLWDAFVAVRASTT